MKFSDFERVQMSGVKTKEEMDQACLHCPECQCQWFEELTVQRFQENHNIILGQNIPPRPGSMGYKFLRCIQCSNIIEPHIQQYGPDYSVNDYNLLLDVLEGKK